MGDWFTVLCIACRGGSSCQRAQIVFPKVRDLMNAYCMYWEGAARQAARLLGGTVSRTLQPPHRRILRKRETARRKSATLGSLVLTRQKGVQRKDVVYDMFRKETCGGAFAALYKRFGELIIAVQHRFSR